MWIKSHTIIAQGVTKEQMWKLFANVNAWQTWDSGLEFARMEGEFEKGNHFTLRPKGGPTVKIELIETIKNETFTDLTRFPLAKMYGVHVFKETPDGLQITTTMKVKGLLSFLWVKIVAQKIVDGLPEDMKTQVEAARKL